MFDKKMLVSFYRFAKRKSGAWRFFAALSNSSAAVFAVLYCTLLAALFFASGRTTFILNLAVPACALGVSLLTRVVVRRPRPKSSAKKSFTFPSNHAVCAGIIAFGFFYVNFFVGTIVFALAFLTGISRVFTGAHYPSDVAGGFIISGIVAIAGYSVLPMFL